MIWFFIGIIILIIYFASTRRRDPSEEFPEMNDMNHVSFDKNRVNGALLIQLEQFGDKYYFEAIEAQKKQIQYCADQISGKEKIFFSKAQTAEYLKNANAELKNIEDMRYKFVRLKEKFKHNSIPEKLFVYQDWADYLWSIHRTNTNRKQLNYAPDNDSADKIYNEMHEIYLQMEEIEKRFDERLK